MATSSSLQRKPFWAPIGLAGAFALAAALGLALLGWILVTAVTSKPTTVIVVREAETVQEGAADPALSAEGQARAERLSRVLGDLGPGGRVDTIYVLPALATQATAMPLAQRLGIHPTVIEPGAARGWASRLIGEHRGGRILVVTHADGARELAAELGGVDDLAPILPTQFGVLFIVTAPHIGRANLVRLDY